MSKPDNRRSADDADRDESASALEDRPLAGIGDEWVVPDGAFVRKSRPVEKAGSLIDAFMKDSRWADRMAGSKIFSVWAEIVGDQLAEHTEPVKLYNNQLVIRAENQAWATQIKYLHNQLLMRADEVLGHGAVREVTVTVGRLQGTTD